VDGRGHLLSVGAPSHIQGWRGRGAISLFGVATHRRQKALTGHKVIIPFDSIRKRVSLLAVKERVDATFEGPGTGHEGATGIRINEKKKKTAFTCSVAVR